MAEPPWAPNHSGLIWLRATLVSCSVSEAEPGADVGKAVGGGLLPGSGLAGQSLGA